MLSFRFFYFYFFIKMWDDIIEFVVMLWDMITSIFKKIKNE